MEYHYTLSQLQSLWCLQRCLDFKIFTDDNPEEGTFYCGRTRVVLMSKPNLTHSPIISRHLTTGLKAYINTCILDLSKCAKFYRQRGSNITALDVFPILNLPILSVHVTKQKSQIMYMAYCRNNVLFSIPSEITASSNVNDSLI